MSSTCRATFSSSIPSRGAIWASATVRLCTRRGYQRRSPVQPSRTDRETDLRATRHPSIAEPSSRRVGTRCQACQTVATRIFACYLPRTRDLRPVGRSRAEPALRFAGIGCDESPKAEPIEEESGHVPYQEVAAVGRLRLCGDHLQRLCGL